ncbi:alkaline ceramidase ydc1 [Tieghemiomyces parasiticus]|uniref:Alkaline ceramidase ydc1 n=1 Tax=Tieghemiomyces parasiticus TaxID=78921 RepID=A0A9W8DY08_9FUNG|nr:alkaline ceramidase ydc1 [Tieghemiomyces parasiticus]KAJ1930754.1 alkaline ceramidase ydc1 [Tieghemiomyces parasiticus]
MDELPMIYATSISMYCLFEMNKRAGMDWKLLGLLVLYCTFVTVAYLLTHEPVFHQVAYALQMFIVLGRSVHLVRSIPQGPYRRSLAKLATFSSLTFAGGFVMWNLDNAFCSQLQSARHSVGLPLAAVFQFHGWWHVLTSLGCYGFILLNQAMRLYFLGRHHKFSICYYRGLLPYLHHNLDDKGFL